MAKSIRYVEGNTGFGPEVGLVQLFHQMLRQCQDEKVREDWKTTIEAEVEHVQAFKKEKSGGNEK